MWLSSVGLALLAIPLGYLFRLIPVQKERFEREAIEDEKLRHEARNKQYIGQHVETQGLVEAA